MRRRWRPKRASDKPERLTITKTVSHFGGCFGGNEEWTGEVSYDIINYSMLGGLGQGDWGWYKISLTLLSIFNPFSSRQRIGTAQVTGRTWDEQSALNSRAYLLSRCAHATPTHQHLAVSHSISCTVFAMHEVFP